MAIDLFRRFTAGHRGSVDDRNCLRKSGKNNDKPAMDQRWLLKPLFKALVGVWPAVSFWSGAGRRLISSEQRRTDADDDGSTLIGEDCQWRTTVQRKKSSNLWKQRRSSTVRRFVGHIWSIYVLSLFSIPTLEQRLSIADRRWPMNWHFGCLPLYLKNIVFLYIIASFHNYRL